MISFLSGFFRKPCAHASVKENLACDCICVACGKNLGFIGSLADSYPHSRVVGYTGQVEQLMREGKA